MIAAGAAAVLVLSPAGDLNQTMEQSTVVVSTHDSQGSAFFVSRRRLVTAAHVVSGADRVRLTFAPGSGTPTRTARVVAADSSSDIAVLQVAESAGTALRFASAPPEAGAQAFVMGAPSQEFRVTAGTVLEADASTVVSSARVFPGNSGGPLVDESGQVLGLVVQRTEPSNEAVAVAAARVQQALRDLPQAPRAAAAPDPVSDPATDPIVMAAFVMAAAALLLIAGVAAYLTTSARNRGPHIVIKLD